MVRVRAVNVATYNSTSGVATTLDLNVDSKWIPEVDISYFFNKNVATELILTWPQKMTVNAGNTAIGSIKVLPPTLLLQYHFDGLPVKPYVGAGINYTNYSGVSLPAGVSIDNGSWGGALQAGVDIPLTGNMYLNLDVKKVWMGTDVYVAASTPAASKWTHCCGALAWAGVSEPEAVRQEKAPRCGAFCRGIEPLFSGSTRVVRLSVRRS